MNAQESARCGSAALTHWRSLTAHAEAHELIRRFTAAQHKRFLRPSGADDGRGVLPDIEVSSGEALDCARRLIVSRAVAPPRMLRM